MLRGAVIALKYALFAAVATGVNLSSQWIGLQLYSGPWSLAAAMAAGTATGLAAKYLLDKQWIFYDADSGVSAHARKFSLYTVMGVVTTAIFWGMELTFNAIEFGKSIALPRRRPGAGHRLLRQVSPRSPLRFRARAMMLSGWGRFPRVECRWLDPGSADEAVGRVRSDGSLIPRGNGRSYGDAALNPRGTLSLLRNNRMLAFDAATGLLTCEAGLLLADVLDVFMPRGWFPAVTPGTKFVTIGGMIAADVHGKNHHGVGSFGAHVDAFDLALADGRVVRCSRQENAELFAATRGGMGLTGLILRATFKLIPIETAFIRQEAVRAADLDDAMEQLEASRGWSYTVAWIDCSTRRGGLGRSILYRGEHARRDELQAVQAEFPLAAPRRRTKSVPIDFPSFALNPWTVRGFNEMYYRLAKPGTTLIDYDRYFYPLDAILDWNRLYGARGFVQYQCVLPRAASRAGLGMLLDRITAAGSGSFLTTLKLLGPEAGYLSFPLEGYTLALDFPATAQTMALLRELDAIVADHGGRIYLAKDARMDAAMLRRSYAALGRFGAVRASVDPSKKFSSLLSERLNL